MSAEIDKKYVEYVKSQLPYTTIFASQAFRAGYKEAQKEIEQLQSELAKRDTEIGACNKQLLSQEMFFNDLNTLIDKKDAIIAEALEMLNNIHSKRRDIMIIEIDNFLQQHKVKGERV